MKNLPNNQLKTRHFSPKTDRVGIRTISDYSPFGVLLPERTVNAGDYRRSFQGQETDSEVKGAGNSVNYKYRMHDPRIGRFFAVDPLAPKYPFYSPYAFSGNRVIDAVELEGLEPGKLFLSADAAAKDWAYHFNDASIRQNREYASTIYKIETADGIRYSYTKPNKGGIGTGAVKPSTPVNPSKREVVADIHSHGAYDELANNNQFSGEDRSFLTDEERKSVRGDSDIGGNNEDKINGYLASPNGQLQKYNHYTGDVTSISSSIPSDPNEPVKRNDDVAKKSYDNIINLGGITFNSDKARKSESGNYLIVKDLETEKDYTVVRNDNGTYRFKTKEDK